MVPVDSSWNGYVSGDLAWAGVKNSGSGKLLWVIILQKWLVYTLRSAKLRSGKTKIFTTTVSSLAIFNFNKEECRCILDLAVFVPICN